MLQESMGQVSYQINHRWQKIYMKVKNIKEEQMVLLQLTKQI
jgi:hypothetical protein